MSTGTLYLVPTGLGSPDAAQAMPQATRDVVARLDCFVAENAKTARAFLKSAGYPKSLREARIEILDEHTPASRVADLLAPLESGSDCGLMSEAGAPGVADPGALLVRAAHQRGIRVVPLVGPSAVLLALMACGLNGQRFAFHGYLPVERAARAGRLRALELASERSDETQVFIETPYRNDALLAAIVETCRRDTLVCVASDLTLATESIVMRPVEDWKNSRPVLDRRPSVFLLYRVPRQKR